VTAWAAIIASLSSACVDVTGPPFPRIEETEFAASLGIDLDEMTAIEGGIYIQDLMVGSGTTIAVGQVIEVSYSMYLADGRLVERRENFSYRANCLEVRPHGLPAGVYGMKVGGRRRIIVPGRWGYGTRPPPDLDVPVGAILVFVVDALSTRRDNDDIPC